MKKIFFLIWSLILLPGFGQKFFHKLNVSPEEVQLNNPETLPEHYSLYRVDKDALLRSLSAAPGQFAANHSSVTVELPLPDGSVEEFKIFRTHPLSKELARLYPSNHSFRGIGSKGHRVRLDINSSGVFYMIYGTEPSPAVFRIAAPGTYILFYQAWQHRPAEHQCLAEELPPSVEELARPSQIDIFGDGLVRKYRLAFAADGEFSQFHVQNAINNGTLPANATDAEKKQAVLDAITVIVNRINEIYEVDMAITLELVPNNINIIYLDPNTDPYDNSSPISLLNQNQSTCDNVIGSSNYDIGHVGTTGGGGLARRGCVCINGQKAMGETGLAQPIGDAYAVDFAAHEMGHQFGANHTFANYCAGNRNDATAVEPGSGTTIMAYAGVCAPNVQDHSDPQFHYVSQSEIWQHVITNTCAQTISANNTPPQVTVGPDRYIPKETPFMIEVSATDAETPATLTYTWDEVDVYQDSGQTNAAPDPSNTTGPMFRVLPLSDKPVRYFPNMADILNGNYGNEWEVLPSVSRLLRFQVVARDNVTPGGQFANDRITLGVDANAGPFRVTSHQNDTVLTPGATLNITWNVAGTDQGNVNCQYVDILFSRNGGKTFTDTLATNVPNTGAYTVTLPAGVASCNGHYMVKGHDNYFFDVNHGKLLINCQCNDITETPMLNIPDNDATGITSTIDIQEQFYVEDIRVRVNITHTYVQDLKIKLTSPAGTEVYLFNRNCGNEDDLDIIFDDSAPDMVCGTLALGNRYHPVEPLYPIIGEQSNGTWALTVTDHYSGDDGTLNYWILTLCKSAAATSTEEIQNVRVYPVPASNQLHVSFLSNGEDAYVTVTDLNGRLISRADVDDAGLVEVVWNVRKWAPGIYIIRIQDGKNQAVRKVIVR